MRKQLPIFVGFEKKVKKPLAFNHVDSYPRRRVFVVNSSMVSNMCHFNKVLIALCICRLRVLNNQSVQNLRTPNNAGNARQIL